MGAFSPEVYQSDFENNIFLHLLEGYFAEKRYFSPWYPSVFEFHRGRVAAFQKKISRKFKSARGTLKLPVANRLAKLPVKKKLPVAI